MEREDDREVGFTLRGMWNGKAVFSPRAIDFESGVRDRHRKRPSGAPIEGQVDGHGDAHYAEGGGEDSKRPDWTRGRHAALERELVVERPSCSLVERMQLRRRVHLYLNSALAVAAHSRSQLASIRLSSAPNAGYRCACPTIQDPVLGSCHGVCFSHHGI